MTDPIADMLTRIRNANKEKLKLVDMPLSKTKEAIAKVMFEEGYIRKYEILENKENPQPILRITLKYDEDNNRVISGLKRISKPGLRIYSKYNEIPQVLNGLRNSTYFNITRYSYRQKSKRAKTRWRSTCIHLVIGGKDVKNW